jgi:hypothetical protein
MWRFIAGGLFRRRQTFHVSRGPALFQIDQFFLGAVKADLKNVDLPALGGKDIAQILYLPVLMCHQHFKFFYPVISHKTCL